MAKKGVITAARSAAFGLFKDQETDWATRRALEYMGERAAEIGEVLYAVRRIDERDGESWIDEWSELAARVEAHGERSLAGGHLVSARDCFMRASNYYRNAEYGTSPTHPRFDALWRKSVDTFKRAGALYSPPLQCIDVHFEDKILPGYFWRPDNDHKNRPTLIACGGNDSSLEEIAWITGFAALRRGYNFFTFDHPGHRGAVHLYNDCIKRHDYEVPYKAAIDLLETVPGVDERLAMTGYSFGGYVSTRVAAHEPRIKAIAPNSPIVDSWDVTVAFMGSMLDTFQKMPAWALDIVNVLYQKKMARTPVLLAFKQYTDWAGGLYPTDLRPLDKINAAVNFLKPFQVRDRLENITAPALAMVSDADGDVLLAQAQEFLDGISSPVKRLHRFSLSTDGADDHCQLDNRSRGSEVLFDFLDEVFEYDHNLEKEL